MDAKIEKEYEIFKYFFIFKLYLYFISPPKTQKLRYKPRRQDISEK